MGKRTWSDEDLKVLYDNFPEGGIYKCIELLPHKTRKQIKGKIDALHIKSNHYDKWTDEENLRLKEAWETFTMEDLLAAFPGRTYQKIQLHANQLGYHAKTDRKRKTNLDFLELDHLTKESLYWWGFLMADGHIGKNGQLILQLKDVDKEHVDKFAAHVNSSVKTLPKGFVRTVCTDIRKVRNWMEIFQMKDSAKTYFPPVLDIFEKDFIYFFIGFVDGDGCIWFSKGYPQLKIELYSTWKDNLDWFAEILKRDYGLTSVTTKISKKGTAVLTIGNRKDIKTIADFTTSVECLERKWGKIQQSGSIVWKP